MLVFEKVCASYCIEAIVGDGCMPLVRVNASDGEIEYYR